MVGLHFVNILTILTNISFRRKADSRKIRRIDLEDGERTSLHLPPEAETPYELQHAEPSAMLKVVFVPNLRPSHHRSRRSHFLARIFGCLPGEGGAHVDDLQRVVHVKRDRKSAVWQL